MIMMFLHLATCIYYEQRILITSMGSILLLVAFISFSTLMVFSSDLCSEVFLSEFRKQANHESNEIPVNDVCNEGCSFGPGASMALMTVWSN
jgi:hypothetical protein